MGNHKNPSHPWQQHISQLAYQATLREAKKRWDLDKPAVNYRWEHVQTVVKLGLELAGITGADPEIVEAAAWLHDYHKRGKDDDHAQKGARTARELLSQTDFPLKKISGVCNAIASHVGLYKDALIEPLEAAVLWDADKLSKLGITSLFHFVGFWAAADRGSLKECLSELQAALEWQEKTVLSFNTEPARRAGHKRLKDQKEFLNLLQGELEGKDLEARS
ncbi:MAG: HD domain-containing protein [Anaerolineales bacterium]|nr:HD domain-containing protein [Anaerolineales bacterium]